MSFRENVYPLLRRCERYLDQLPRKFDRVRDEFQRVKERVWARWTGRKLNFADEFELKRQEPPLRREKKLEMGKVLGRNLFRRN